MANRLFSAFLVLGLFNAVAGGEAPPQAPNPTQPGTPAAPSSSNNVKIFDDRVFDLESGGKPPETRTSAGGNTRYLDNTKDFNYNSEQSERWKNNCRSLKEADSKAYRECFEGQKRKELGRNAREPRSGSDGLDKPAPMPAPRGMERPSTPEAEEPGE